MTRFEKEWHGLLGEYWEKASHEEVEKLLKKKDEIDIEDDGAAKWKSNGKYLPSDVVQKLVYGGADWFSPEATSEKRDIQTAEDIERYKHSRKPITSEEMHEMRAAFGSGETVADILSGERIVL